MTLVDFVLLALGLIVVVAWAAPIMIRGGLVATMLLLLLAGSVFGHPFFHVNTGALPLTSDRILLIVLCGQYVLYRRWGRTDSKPAAKVDLVLAAFLLLLTFGTFTHNFRIDGWWPVAMLIISWFMPATLYWIARQTRYTESAAWWVLGSLAVFGLYLCVTAVAETHGKFSVVFPRYITSPTYFEFFGRGRGPFLNPVANGIVQSIGLCAALLWWPRLSRRWQLVLLATIPIYAWGVYSTLTRSVWMGAVCGVGVVVTLSTPRVWRGVVVGGMVMATVLGTAIFWESILTFKRDKELDAELTAESAKLRPILATVAWHMFLDRPLLGCGFAQYREVMPDYLADRSTELPLIKARPFVQHNAFLALLTETGLIGAGLFSIMLLAWTWQAFTLWHADGLPLWEHQLGLMFLAAIGIYLPNAMFHDVSLVAMVNMFMFFLGGSAVGLALKERAAGTTANVRMAMAPWWLKSYLLHGTPGKAGG